jgi:hypothetical protein
MSSFTKRIVNERVAEKNFDKKAKKCLIPTVVPAECIV